LLSADLLLRLLIFKDGTRFRLSGRGFAPGTQALIWPARNRMSIPHFVRRVNRNPHAAINGDLRLAIANPTATVPRMIRPAPRKIGEHRTASKDGGSPGGPPRQTKSGSAEDPGYGRGGDVLRFCALAADALSVFSCFSPMCNRELRRSVTHDSPAPIGAEDSSPGRPESRRSRDEG
jgi:hypothetical protein